MKKTNFKTFFISILMLCGICGTVLTLWIMLCVLNIHCRLLSLSILGMADIYKTAGTVSLNTPDGIKTVQIYKQNKKPFLLVGPYKFADDYNDFFFVSRNYVIRTATDKGGEWVTWGNYLLIDDDMTLWDRVRAPFWFDAQKDDGKISLNSPTLCYEFKLNLENSDKRPFLFSIPAKYFTNDMPDAELFFDSDKISPPRFIRIMRKVTSP